MHFVKKVPILILSILFLTSFGRAAPLAFAHEMAMSLEIASMQMIDCHPYISVDAEGDILSSLKTCEHSLEKDPNSREAKEVLLSQSAQIETKYSSIQISAHRPILRLTSQLKVKPKAEQLSIDGSPFIMITKEKLALGLMSKKLYGRTFKYYIV